MKITNDDDDDGWQHRWPSPIWLIHRECLHVKIGFDWANRFIKGIAIVITVNGQHRAVSTHCWAAVPQFCCHLHPFLSFSIEEQFDVAEKGCPFATAVKLKLKAGDWDECSTGEQFRAVTGSKVKKVKDEDGAMAEKGGKTERKSAVQLWILSCSTVYFDTKLLLLINDTSRQKAAWRGLKMEEGKREKKREKRRDRAAAVAFIDFIGLVSTSSSSIRNHSLHTVCVSIPDFDFAAADDDRNMVHREKRRKRKKEQRCRIALMERRRRSAHFGRTMAQWAEEGSGRSRCRQAVGTSQPVSLRQCLRGAH